MAKARSMQHSDIRSFLTEFVADSARMEYSIQEIAEELSSLGMHGSEVPKATSNQWLRELERCVDDGVLALDGNGRVRIPAEEARPTQMDLF